MLPPLPHLRPYFRRLPQLRGTVADHADHLRAVLPRKVVPRDVDGQETGQSLDAVVGRLEVADEEAQVHLRGARCLHNLLDERKLVGQILLGGGSPGNELTVPLPLNGLESVAGLDFFVNGGVCDDAEVLLKVFQRQVGRDGEGQKGFRACFDLLDIPLKDLKDFFIPSASSEHIYEGTALIIGSLDFVQRSQSKVGRHDHQIHPQYIFVEKMSDGSSTLLLLTKPGLSFLENFLLDELSLGPRSQLP